MQSLETQQPAPPSPPPRRVQGFVFWLAAAAVIALDQGTKAIVRASLDRGEAWPEDWPVKIRYVTNTGAAFGILQDQTVFLIAMALIGLGAIYIYYRNPPFNHPIVSAAIGMMLGGAAGNLIDRIRVGRVTDFIDFPRYPNFNIADSSIFIGVAIIIGAYLLWGSPRQHAGPSPDEAPPADG